MSSEHIERRRMVEDECGNPSLWKIIESPLLKPREREVLTLKIRDDLTHGEISERLHCSERTVQRIYKKAIRKIAGALLY